MDAPDTVLALQVSVRSRGVYPFLHDHPLVADVLPTALSHIRKHFGVDSRVEIDTFSDPDGEGEMTLFLHVMWSGQVEDAMERLRAFDEDWYLDQSPELLVALNVTVDFSMSYNWREFLDLAKGLNANPERVGPRNASLRSAVSRAYYAAFNAACEAARRDGFVRSRSRDDHEAIRRHYRNLSGSGSRAGANISTQLSRLNQKRGSSDYASHCPSLDSESSAAITMAEIVFSELDKL